MRLTSILLVYAAILLAGYFAGRRKGMLLSHGSGGVGAMHSLPDYHGYYVMLWGALPALAVILGYLVFSDALVIGQVVASLPDTVRGLPEPQLNLIVNDIRNIAAGTAISSQDPTGSTELAAEQLNRLREMTSMAFGLAVMLIAAGGCMLGWRSLRPTLRARNKVEMVVMICLGLAASVAVLTTVGIVFSVLFESIRFFQKVPFYEFLFGVNWSPQTAIRADQVGSSGSFGAVPLFLGTLMISSIAMVVALPIGLMVAIYLSEYTNSATRTVVKPLLEVLAGIPTVVYGYFAALTVAPFLRAVGVDFGFEISSESALGAGLVMGIMILPFVSSISDDVINSVPQSIRDGSYGLGATQSETIVRVILPAALPGIVGGFLLAVSRAIGETMIVVMAAGLAANMTLNPLEAVTTVTVQIVTLLVGDQEFDSAKTLAAFGLGLTLFIVTLILNIIALSVVRKYREQYD